MICSGNNTLDVDKGPKKMILLCLVPFSFLVVVLSCTTQGYFHPITFDFEVTFQVFVIVNYLLSLKGFTRPMN
jgi:hypothetical protein